MACAAHGCELPGSFAESSSGRYTCLCHSNQPLDRWQRITFGIRSNGWLVDLIRAVRQDTTGKRWRTLAERDFAMDLSYAPHPQETQSLYAYRLQLELQHAAGARADRPEPMLPQGGGKFARRGGNLGLEGFTRRRGAGEGGDAA